VKEALDEIGIEGMSVTEVKGLSRQLGEVLIYFRVAVSFGEDFLPCLHAF